MPAVVPEDQIAGKIEENKIYKLKKTGATANDIVNVWNYVSAYISEQMQKTKGVNIIGLGTFTFTQRRTDVGNNKYILAQRPVFVLSERFAQQHQLACNRYHLTGQIPVSDLNFTAVAFDTPFTRDLVEECVRDVITEFSRAISAGKNIEFSFAAVGRLSIRNRKVKMKFYKEFINSLDSGEEMIASMKDRPDTADSVMTRCSVRPASMNTMVLPSIGGGTMKKPTMAAIDENAEAKLDEVGKIEDPNMQTAIEEMEKSGEIYFGEEPHLITIDEPAMNAYNEMGAQELDDMGLPGMLLEEQPHPDAVAAKEMLQRSGSRMLAPVSKAGAMNLDDITPRPVSHTPASRIMGEPMKSLMTPVPGGAPVLSRSYTMPAIDGDMRKSPKSVLSPIIPGAGELRSHRSAEPAKRVSSMGQPWPAERRSVTPVGSACGHNNAGQELCYLCHQRAARNIPVSFEEERKKRELEEDKVLHDYQIMKNNEFILNENEKNLAKRHALQKMAAFNQGVAEALNERRNARPQKEHPKAYIFQRRALTPPAYVKQQQLNDYLNQQVDVKDNMSKKEKAEKAFLERLEQVQLAEDLAAQRDMFMREKAKEREKYKDALATQLKYKPLQVPDKLPDGEVFGKNDTTQADVIARRAHAKRISDEMSNIVSDRKRAEILKKLQEQQNEEERLRKNREEIRDDRSKRHHRQVLARRALEDDWVKSAEQKRNREVEERLRCLTPGNLMHEQCDQYKRCAQCRRKMGNCGETNLWRESRYIPGARIMV